MQIVSFKPDPQSDLIANNFWNLIEQKIINCSRKPLKNLEKTLMRQNKMRCILVGVAKKYIHNVVERCWTSFSEQFLSFFATVLKLQKNRDGQKLLRPGSFPRSFEGPPGCINYFDIHARPELSRLCSAVQLSCRRSTVDDFDEF